MKHLVLVSLALLSVAATAGEKLSKGLVDRLARAIPPGTANGKVMTLSIAPESPDELAAMKPKIEAAGGRIIAAVGRREGCPVYRVEFDELAASAAVETLEAENTVGWLETYERPRFFNDVAVKSGLMNVEPVRETYNLTGSGQIITTSDSGIDTGDMSTMSADLKDNLLGFAGVYDGTEDEVYIYKYDKSGHGTHTAGSLVGTGALSDGKIKGVACGAKLWAWFCGGAEDAVYIPNELDDLFTPEAVQVDGSYTAFIHSASWGGNTNEYNTVSQQLDAWCWQHPDFLPVFAAGNDGSDSTIACQAAAKNVLCVGASENYRPDKGAAADNPDEIAYFSSRGPMPDGRIKPDICAPGSYIVSCRSHAKGANTGWGVYGANTNYCYNGGTSMATPLVAGTLALVREALVDRFGYTNRPPSSALLKAIVTGGATRLGTTTNGTEAARVANNRFGWGRINLGESIYPADGLAVELHDYIPFSQGSEETFRVTVTNTAPFDAQLCYIDYPVSPMTARRKSLVNDLDLVISNELTGVVYAPEDRTNNLEGLHFDEIAAGTPLTVTVKGYLVRYASTVGGAAALFMRGAFVSAIADTNEYVTVTIKGEGGAEGNYETYPTIGTHRCVKGSEVAFYAALTNYEYSSAWGTTSYRYPFLCWMAQKGLEDIGGFGNEFTRTVNEDVEITWYWKSKPSHVKLIIGAFDDYYTMSIYPSTSVWRHEYWCDYDDPVEIGPEMSILAAYFDSSDGGRTLEVNDYLYYTYDNWMYRLPYGTLKLTSVYLMDEDGDGLGYLVDGDDHDRMDLGSFTYPAKEMLAIDFGYADSTVTTESVYKEAEDLMPFWWWFRNFYGAESENGSIEGLGPDDDVDSDGFTAAAEYREVEVTGASTDPWDAESFPFRFTSISNFIARTGATVEVEGSRDLKKWEVERAVETAAVVTNDFEFAASTNAFHRLRYTPQGD